MEHKIGVCSICGGDVVAWHGPWMAVIPPPAPHCARCGAEPAAANPVIPMRQRGAGPRRVGRIHPSPSYPFKWYSVQEVRR